MQSKTKMSKILTHLETIPEESDDDTLVRISLSASVIDVKVEQCIRTRKGYVFPFRQHLIWIKAGKIPTIDELQHDFVGLSWLFFIKDISLDVKVTMMGLRKFLYLLVGLEIVSKVQKNPSICKFRQDFANENLVYHEGELDYDYIREVTNKIGIDQFEVKSEEFGLISCPKWSEIERWKSKYFDSPVNHYENRSLIKV